MDDYTLTSPNNDDIEPTERDDPIVVLSDNDVVDHLSYNNEIISTDEIIRTDNPSTNLVSYLNYLLYTHLHHLPGKTRNDHYLILLSMSVELKISF